MTSNHPSTLFKWHYPERLVSMRYKYKQLIKITKPSPRGTMSSRVALIKKHLFIRTVGKLQCTTKKKKYGVKFPMSAPLVVS